MQKKKETKKTYPKRFMLLSRLIDSSGSTAHTLEPTANGTKVASGKMEMKSETQSKRQSERDGEKNRGKHSEQRVEFVIFIHCEWNNNFTFSSNALKVACYFFVSCSPGLSLSMTLTMAVATATTSIFPWKKLTYYSESWRIHTQTHK